jgi:hypothetical protein
MTDQRLLVTFGGEKAKIYASAGYFWLCVGRDIQRFETLDGACDWLVAYVREHLFQQNRYASPRLSS